MIKTRASIAAVLFPLFATEAQAQNLSCADQLRMGLYNTVRSHSSSSQAASAVRTLCSTYQSLQQTNVTANLMVDVPLLFETNASMSYAQLQALARALCTSSDERSLSNAEQDLVSQTISSDAMQAYRACIEANRRGLQFRRTTTGEDLNVVTVEIAHDAPGTSGVPLQDVRVIPEDAYECAGELWDARRNRASGPSASLTMVRNSFLSMSCRRRVSSSPAQAPGRQVFAPAAQIVVSTGGGTLVTIIPEASVVPMAPIVTAPLGAVMAFAGDTPPSGWMLCDGRSLSRTLYASLFATVGTAHGAPDAMNFNLPDYRGYFLRGADRGAGRDPDRGGRTAMAAGGRSGDGVGSVQGSALGSHNHDASAQMGGAPFSSTPTGESEWRSGFAGGGAFHDSGGRGVSRRALPVSVQVQAAGGSETRPLNASVNWIIRVR